MTQTKLGGPSPIPIIRDFLEYAIHQQEAAIASINPADRNRETNARKEKDAK